MKKVFKIFLKLLVALPTLALTYFAYLLVPFIIVWRQADLYADQFYDWLDSKDGEE